MEIENKNIMIDEASMLEEIRYLLDLTIEKFTEDMDWSNTKYYDFIKNGRRRNNKKQKSRPTIFKIFTGINIAIRDKELWQEHATEITNIVIKYLLPVLKEI